MRTEKEIELKLKNAYAKKSIALSKEDDTRFRIACQEVKLIKWILEKDETRNKRKTKRSL